MVIENKDNKPDDGRLKPPETGDQKPPAASKNTAAQNKDAEDDYLAKYEYHKDTGLPYFMAGNVRYLPPNPESKAAKMKKVLLAQERVRTFIPRPAKESKLICASVNLNGYRLDFPKGTWIYVPQQISEVLDGFV